jgi:hypothetical protein
MGILGFLCTELKSRHTAQHQEGKSKKLSTSLQLKKVSNNQVDLSIHQGKKAPTTADILSSIKVSAQYSN